MFVPLGFPAPPLAGHSIAVTRKVPSAHLMVGVCVVVVGAGAQELPFQDVFIGQPPGGGVGAVGAVVVVGAGAVGGGGPVGLGPPLFSQDACVVPSLQSTA